MKVIGRAVCWITKKHKERRVAEVEAYNRVCARCGATRKARARPKKAAA